MNSDTHLSAQSRSSVCQYQRNDSVAFKYEKRAFYTRLAADKQSLQI